MTIVKVNGNSGVGKWTTAMVTASGQGNIDFTSIPSGVNIIFVTLENLYKGSSNTNTVLQVGNSSGVLTTGYRERNLYANQANVAGGANFGAAAENRIGWVMSGEAAQGATYKLNGTYKLFKIGTGNKWVCDWTAQSQINSYVTIGGGERDVSSALDRVRLTSANGSATFTSGTVTIRYFRP